MKKDGFTLVELLAVIAILAILVVLVLPNVLELFRGSRKNAFISETQSIYKTMEGDLLSKTMAAGGNEYSGTYTNVSGCDGYEAGKTELAIMNSNIKYYIVITHGKVTQFIAQNDAYYTSVTGTNILSDDTVKGNEVVKITENLPYDMTTATNGCKE